MRIRVASWLALCCVLLLPSVTTGEETFIIPGADFSSLALIEGAWCRYRVVDRALGVDDTTEVYIAVLSRLETPEGSAHWVELESKPIGTDLSESEIYKLLVSSSIRNASPEDSLVKYIQRVYIKIGQDPAKAEDPTRLRDVPLGPPAADSTWTVAPGEGVSTPAGDFTCEKKERLIAHAKEIPTGRVRLVEKRNDRWVAWFSESVPIFHLVKCVVERSKETKTIPAVPGIPSHGRRDSQTVAELIGFGFGAKPILQLDP